MIMSKEIMKTGPHTIEMPRRLDFRNPIHASFLMMVHPRARPTQLNENEKSR